LANASSSAQKICPAQLGLAPAAYIRNEQRDGLQVSRSIQKCLQHR
jgi:hypothetical protein